MWVIWASSRWRWAIRSETCLSWTDVGPSVRSSPRRSEPRPEVASPSEVMRLSSQVRVSVSSALSTSSESVGLSVWPTGIVEPETRAPAARCPGEMSTSMSLSGVRGTRSAWASRYIGPTFPGSICMWMTDCPCWSDTPDICPTRTPATLTGSPSPGTTAAALVKFAFSE